MFGDMSTFVMAVLDHWGVLFGAPLLTLLFVLWEKKLQKEVHWSWFRFVLGASLIAAIYLTWRDEALARRTAETDKIALNSALDTTKLELEQARHQAPTIMVPPATVIMPQAPADPRRQVDPRIELCANRVPFSYSTKQTPTGFLTSVRIPVTRGVNPSTKFRTVFNERDVTSGPVAGLHPDGTPLFTSSAWGPGLVEVTIQKPIPPGRDLTFTVTTTDPLLKVLCVDRFPMAPADSVSP